MPRIKISQATAIFQERVLFILLCKLCFTTFLQQPNESTTKTASALSNTEASQSFDTLFGIALITGKIFVKLHIVYLESLVKSVKLAVLLLHKRVVKNWNTTRTPSDVYRRMTAFRAMKRVEKVVAENSPRLELPL